MWQTDAKMTVPILHDPWFLMFLDPPPLSMGRTYDLFLINMLKMRGRTLTLTFINRFALTDSPFGRSKLSCCKQPMERVTWSGAMGGL